MSHAQRTRESTRRRIGINSAEDDHQYSWMVFLDSIKTLTRYAYSCTTDQHHALFSHLKQQVMPHRTGINCRGQIESGHWLSNHIPLHRCLRRHMTNNDALRGKTVDTQRTGTGITENYAGQKTKKGRKPKKKKKKNLRGDVLHSLLDDTNSKKYGQRKRNSSVRNHDTYAIHNVPARQDRTKKQCIYCQ